MLADPVEALAVTAVSILLSYAAFRQNMLTARGSASAFAVSAAIGLFGGLSWLLLILSFVAAAFITTRFKLLDKAKMGLQEGRRGERGSRNVVANSMPAVCVALLSTLLAGYAPQSYFAMLFTVAIGSATADTLASEIGVINRHPRLITTMKPVPPGTDGGVSALGTAASFGGALFIAVAGYALIVLLGDTMPLWSIPFTAVLGFSGSVIDSILGATLERRGIIGKQSNNISSIVLACLAAAVLLAL